MLPVTESSNTPGYRARYSVAILFALGLVMMVSTVRAQLQQVPLKRSGAPASLRPAKSAVGRTQAEVVPADTLELPFWDDFSFTPLYDGDSGSVAGYPLRSLWFKSDGVWINDGAGINPPTRNVATFDGLDLNSIPYSNQPLYNGFRDTLMSNPIRLNQVAAADRDSVYLSFAYQWQGNGEAPDRNDYLRVDFRNAEGAWVNVMTIPFRGSFDRTVFYDTIVKVNGAQYFHKSFQFRILSYGRQSGPYDTWNVDYVYLNKSRSGSTDDLRFPDRAITSALGSLFGQYRSVPINHFVVDRATVAAPFTVSNLSDHLVSVNYQAHLTLSSYDNGDVISQTQNLGDAIAIKPGNSGVIDSREHVVVETLPQPDMSVLNAATDSASVRLEIIFNSGDNVYRTPSTPNGDYISTYAPIDFRANDTLRADYQLTKYYAYDDGTAEYSAILPEAGSRGAALFEMLIPSDTLIGFDILFPDWGINGTVTTDFYVYNDNNGIPGLVLYTLASRQIQRKGDNVFQRFMIGEPFTVTNKFYIAWKAPVGTTLPVGLDFSSDSGDRIYSFVNGTWEQNIDIHANLMIRPLFGYGGTNVGIENPARSAGVYPNPNTGRFFITGDVDRFELMTITGQPVSVQSEAVDNGVMVSADDAKPGLYILRLYKKNSSSTRKLIIR